MINQYFLTKLTKPLPNWYQLADGLCYDMIQKDLSIQDKLITAEFTS